MAFSRIIVKTARYMSVGLMSCERSLSSGRLLSPEYRWLFRTVKYESASGALGSCSPSSSRYFESLAASDYRSNGSHSGQNTERPFKQWIAAVTALVGSAVAGHLIMTGHTTIKADDGSDVKSKLNFSIKDLTKKVKDKIPDPSSGMVLYWASGSPPCWRVMIALQEKNLTNYQSKIVEMSKDEHKSEEVLAINPRGQVPTFKHDDIVINESLAIVDYLESYFPYMGTQLLPTIPRQRATVLQRKYESLNLFHKGIQDYTFYTFRKPEEKNKKDLEARLKAFREELDIWENVLKQAGPDNYVAGKEFSMADIALFPTLALFWRLGLNLEKYPNLKAYFDKVRQRESVQKTWPPHWTGDNKKVLTDV